MKEWSFLIPKNSTKWAPSFLIVADMEAAASVTIADILSTFNSKKFIVLMTAVEYGLN